MSSQRACPREVRDLIPEVYQQLRWIAKSFAKKTTSSLTLQPTELVNEACIRLMHCAGLDCQGPEHFRAIATKTIWRVLIDHLRKRRAQKRTADPEYQIPSSTTVAWMDREVDFVELAHSIEGLAGVHLRLRDIVVLHWFGGFTHQEVARSLEISTSTVEKDCRFALAWMNRTLNERAHES